MEEGKGKKVTQTLLAYFQQQEVCHFEKQPRSWEVTQLRERATLAYVRPWDQSLTLNRKEGREEDKQAAPSTVESL